MRYTRLGKTGIDVSTIGLGTWAFGGEWGAVDRDEAKAVVHRALDLGVTLFDTAQGYGFGVSERLLGEALWERVKREEVVVATKGGLRMDGDTLVRDSSAAWLREGVESSLRALGTEYIDLYQVHWPDPDTSFEVTGGVLEELVKEGKIRHAGVSNFTGAQMDELARHGPVETLQPPYHLFRREIEEDILPYAEAHDIGVLVYGPLAHGLLSGHMTPETQFAADDWRAGASDFSGETLRRNLEVVERLKTLAEGLGISLPRLATAWTLSHPAVDVALVGARRPSQLDETVAAADVVLSDKDLREVDEIMTGAAPVQGPSPEM